MCPESNGSMATPAIHHPKDACESPQVKNGDTDTSRVLSSRKSRQLFPPSVLRQRMSPDCHRLSVATTRTPGRCRSRLNPMYPLATDRSGVMSLQRWTSVSSLYTAPSVAPFGPALL